MKKLILAALLFVACGSASAEKGDQYLIPKVGFMLVDLNSADPLFSGGVMYGYGLTPEITVEAEVNIGLVGGEYVDSNGEGDYRIMTAAGYGVYRYPVTNTDYIKAKVGVLHESVKKSGFDAVTDQGIAGGIGYGFRYVNTVVEIELTLIDKDIAFYSLGINHPF